MAAQARATLPQVDALRASLAAYLEARGVNVRTDEDMTPRQAAAQVTLPVKVVYKAVRSGLLPARRRGGAWVLREADVREWAQRREKNY